MKTQIVIGEMLAVCSLFRYFPALLQDRSNVIFIDLMGVIHSDVNGNSSSLDLGVFASASQKRGADLNSLNWWGYVASESNLSGGGSRVYDFI